MRSLSPTTVVATTRRHRMSPLVKGCRSPAGYRRVRRTRPAGVGQAFTTADIRAPKSVSDRGPRGEFFWKFSEPIRAPGRFVGLFLRKRCPASHWNGSRAARIQSRAAWLAPQASNPPGWYGSTRDDTPIRGRSASDLACRQAGGLATGAHE